jgi:hypothetical protein
MKYKIDHDIPIPNKINEKGVSSAIQSLKIGESFECESSNRSSAYSSARYYKMKVAVRKTKNGKIRVWRIKT